MKMKEVKLVISNGEKYRIMQSDEGLFCVQWYGEKRICTLDFLGLPLRFEYVTKWHYFYKDYGTLDCSLVCLRQFNNINKALKFIKNNSK